MPSPCALKAHPCIRPRLLVPFLDLGYSLTDTLDCDSPAAPPPYSAQPPPQSASCPIPVSRRARAQSFYYAPAHSAARPRPVNRRQRAMLSQSAGALQPAVLTAALHTSLSPPPTLSGTMPCGGVPLSPSPSPPPSCGCHRDWTREFQEALEMPCSEPQDRLLRSSRIRQIATEFADLATRHGKTIIAEAFLPPHAPRTLLPIEAGGAAGGQKYLVEGIFFKFAVDVHGLYGGDEYAMKAAGHELLGVNAYFNCSIPGLYLPLVAVIDYCGFRLVATSEIPLEAGSLIYGSCDGGHTVLADHQAAEKMEQAARILNLKAHRAGAGSSAVTLHAPCDIEVHKARDGRLYVLDAARVFPPERPVRSRPGSHLYMLLRPELVRGYRCPLSSDAFTLFGGPDNAAVHNEEVAGAQRKLLLEVIPTAAISLNQRAKRILAAKRTREMSTAELADELQLVDEIHREGINIRYLPLLKRTEGAALDPRLCVVINTEIAARRAKNRLRDYMRTQLRSGCRALDLVELARAINLTICAVSLQAIGTEGVDMPLFLERLQAMLGLRFNDGARARVAAESLLDDGDIREIVPLVRHTGLVPYQEGVALYQQALSGRCGPGEADALLQVAAEKFQQALQKQPDDCTILTHWGILLVERAKLLEGVPGASAQRDDYFRGAVEKFADAVRARRGHHYALTHWGEALKLWAATKQGEQAKSLLAQAEQKLREANLLGKRWFFGTLPTSGARGLLTTPRSSSSSGRTRGLFFIRTSYARPGHFIFSVIVRDPKDGKEKLRDIMIEETREGKYYLATSRSASPSGSSTSSGTSPTQPELQQQQQHAAVCYDTLEDLVVAKTREGFRPILHDWTHN
eukprot:m51a1_g5636 hypothetical protein (858) ;mRNA; r:832057-834976